MVRGEGMKADRFRFRAWDGKNKCWAVYRDLMYFCLIGECTMFDLLNQYRIEEYDTLIMTQSIGLNDNQDDEMFIGDICFTSNGKRWVIEEKDFAIIARCISLHGRPFKETLTLYAYKRLLKNAQLDINTWFKIIGNIYENPELLKVNK